MNKIKLNTEIIFGENAMEALEDKLKELKVKKVLITYGGGSVKRNKIFDAAVKQIEKAGATYVEFGGIEPNPRHTTIDKAAEVAKNEKVDLILAIGGGSTVDASKIIGAKATNDWNSCWDYVKNGAKLEKAPLPLGAVITLAGTASENNSGSVVTNEGTKEKYACGTKAPLFAIEDPKYTYTVSKWQTASGSFDAFSHILEQFFGPKPFSFSDNMTVALLKTIIQNAPVAIKEPENYEARESLMITASFGLNHVVQFKEGSDWFVHQLEHAISGEWDITHGAGLATISYYYYKQMIEKSEEYKAKAKFLAKELFGKETAQDFITELKKFIELIGLPTKLTDYEEIESVSEKDIDKMLSHTTYRGALNLSDEDMRKLIKEMI